MGEDGADVRIVYDHRIFSVYPYGGIARYIAELASRVGRLEGCRTEVWAPLHMNEFLRAERTTPIRGRYLAHLPKTGWLRTRFNEMATSRWLRRDPPDIVHHSYYPLAPVRQDRTRTVVTVHDMIHERFPQFFPSGDRTAAVKRRAVLDADYVICVSENTRADLLNAIPLDPDRVSVVYHGFRLRATAPEAAEPILEPPYLLYVGARDGYKNFPALLEALAGSRLRGSIRIVCMGGGPLREAERQCMRRLGLDSSEVAMVNGDDQALARLYLHAEALVYPSLYEGFGIPPLEAMSFGCPVVCTAVGSLPEVVGDAAELCDPSPAGIAGALERVVFSPERREELRARGRERVRRFSWDACARQTAKIYQSLADGERRSTVAGVAKKGGRA